MKKILLFTIILFKTNHLISQTIEGYTFEKYKPKKVLTVKKAKINYASNKTAREYKTLITQGYKDGDINFAGHYITISWGCGTACMSGAMVDILDGKVYDLPMGETTYFFGCNLNDDEDCVYYDSNSRLFITIICNESDFNFEKTFFINVWDETKKKFILLEKKKSSVKKH